MRFLLLFLAALFALPTEAQQLVTREGPRCMLSVSTASHASGSTGRGQADLQALIRLPRTATFEVTYEGFTPEAQEAFEAAIGVWERTLVSDVPIRVRARWTDLGANVLGSAWPRLLNHTGPAPAGLRPYTWYPFAVADAITGEDQVEGEGEFDVEATLNSAFERWHFDPESAPSTRFDLLSVIVHELGHGLGFIGSARVDDEGRGEIGEATTLGDIDPYAYDLLVEDAAGRSVWDSGLYPNGSLALGEVLRSDSLYWGGPSARNAFGERPPLFAPLAFIPNSSYVHFGREAFEGGPDALMGPVIGVGERFPPPGPVTCAVFEDLGWQVANGCGRAVSTADDAVAPRAGRLVVAPNPSVRPGCAVVDGMPAGPARLETFDVRGRRVSEVAFVVGPHGRAACVPLPALPPGVYAVRARAGDNAARAAWTVAR